jgi:hypothetical protein
MSYKTKLMLGLGTLGFAFDAVLISNKVARWAPTAANELPAFLALLSASTLLTVGSVLMAREIKKSEERSDYFPGKGYPIVAALCLGAAIIVLLATGMYVWGGHSGDSSARMMANAYFNGASGLLAVGGIAAFALTPKNRPPKIG